MTNDVINLLITLAVGLVSLGLAAAVTVFLTRK